MGKSQIAVYAAATCSKSREWPDIPECAPHCSTIILSAEDAADDTLRPRLEAAGADLQHVYVVASVIDNNQRVSFSLQADLENLGRKIDEIGNVGLVIIDPITAYMGAKVDSHRTTDVRAVLELLTSFAAAHNVAVLAITHPPKAPQAKAIHVATGSLAFVAAARLAFLAIKEPETERRLLLPIKNNLGALAPGLGYSLVQHIVSKGIVSSHVAWDTVPVTMTANEALAAGTNSRRAGAVGDAEDFLRKELAGGPRPVEEIQSAAKGAGLAWRTVQRAKKKLQIKPNKNGLDGGWAWTLPKSASTEDRQFGPD
jgi:putative DNA primase/helicase